MRAAQLQAVGKITVSDIAMPSCGYGEVVVKVEVCSLCSTDLKMLSYGHRDLILPRVLGHEVAGVISEAGRDIKNLQKGDRVQIAPGVPCGNCRYCRNGYDNMCDGMRIIGFHLHGGLSQKLLVTSEGVKAGVVNLIPDGLSFEEACFAEPLACCINALNSGEFNASDTVAVFGAGPIGCLLVQLLKCKGASKIFLVEKDKKRLDFASRYGVDHLFLWGVKDVFSTIREETRGAGIDLIISACTEPSIPQQGIDVLAKRGRMVFFSGFMGEEKITVNYSAIHYKELMIRGAYGCTVEQNRNALDLLAEQVVEVEPLITRRFCLAEIDKAFDMLKNKQAMKVVINSFQ